MHERIDCMNASTSSNRRLDIEWIAMKAGVKPANRVSIDPQRADEVETRLRRDGFASMEGTGQLTTRPVSSKGKHLFVNLDASDAQLEFPVLYASGRNGYASEDEHARDGARPGPVERGNRFPLHEQSACRSGPGLCQIGRWSGPKI